MNTIKFNNSTYEVLGFNKNTYFNEGSINSNASCQIRTPNVTSLYALADTGIQTIQIYHDSTLIYELENANGKLASIDEYLMDDHININVNLNLNFVTQEDEVMNEEPGE